MSHLKQSHKSKPQNEEQVYNKVIKALVSNYKNKNLNPNIEIDRYGYVKKFQDNLLTLVRVEDFIDDLKAGAGNELEKKFPAIHSSAALVINSFAPFRSEIGNLSFPPPIIKNERFNDLEFERQCPTSLRGTPPHLDVFLKGNNDKIIAIESKFTEIFQKKSDYNISTSYFDDKPRIWKSSQYYDELERIRDGLVKYHYLDAPQLIKHAFGLMNTFLRHPESQMQQITLLYLYWEPENIETLTGPLKEVYKFTLTNYSNSRLRLVILQHLPLSP